ncbi:MAG: hypothetical protein ACK5B9_08175 [Flavobacteriia bacterium]|jgi:hypothetical protein
MKGYKIFLAWLCTVLVSGILHSIIKYLPYFFEVAESKNRKYEIIANYFKHAQIMTIAISVIAFPTIITLLIRNVIICKKYSFKDTFQKINKTHLLVLFITLMIPVVYVLFMELMGYLIIKRMDHKSTMRFSFIFSSILEIISPFLCYFICAIPIWYFFFKKEIKNSRTPLIFEEKNIELNGEN